MNGNTEKTISDIKLSAVLEHGEDEDMYERTFDFVAEGEITVTITLAEYRSLVRGEAEARERILRYYEAVRDRDKTIQQLAERVRDLEEELFGEAEDEDS